MAGSPLRTFILDGNAKRLFRKDISVQRLAESDCSRDLLVDLFLHLESKHGLAKLLKSTAFTSSSSDKCAFHKHDEENPNCTETE